MVDALHTYKIIASRSDNGTATYSFQRDGVFVVGRDKNHNSVTSWTGGWDDATPWSSGTYSVDFHRYSRYKNTPYSFAFHDIDFPGRDSILLHEDFLTASSQNPRRGV